MEGNFGGGKRWQIWQMTVDSANLFQPNFIHLKEVSRDKIYFFAIMLEYANVNFKVLQPIIQDQGLPEPTSRLSNFVPSKANESVNTEVEKVKHKGPQGARSAPYLILTPTQKFQVVKRAAEHGVTAWLMSQICSVAQTFTMFYGICFPRYFHLENFTICQIFFRQYVHAMNSPNFPTAKVSLHTVCNVLYCYIVQIILHCRSLVDLVDHVRSHDY